MLYQFETTNGATTLVNFDHVTHIFKIDTNMMKIICTNNCEITVKAKYEEISEQWSNARHLERQNSK